MDLSDWSDEDISFLEAIIMAIVGVVMIIFGVAIRQKRDSDREKALSESDDLTRT